MKLLYITSLSGKRINSFMRSAIVAATQIGIEFTLACNTDMAETEYYEDCKKYGIKLKHIPFTRNPLSFSNLRAYRAVMSLMRNEEYDIVHCNTPIGGVIGRLCAHKAGIPHIIYQAHGFHFWKDAPKRNWYIYYPIEKGLAKYCDRMVTINKEDYNTSLGFKLRENGQHIYIPGVGINIDEVSHYKSDPQSVRKELNIGSNQYVYVTTGRLDQNKNVSTIISAFAKTAQPDAILLIVGDGEEREHLERIANKLGVADQIMFLGYRNDVIHILSAADCFVFASFREGLSASLMEAIAVGLPCVASRIRGNTDLLPNSSLLFDPKNADELSKKMMLVRDKLLVQEELVSSAKNILNFDFDSVVEQMKDLYRSCSKA